MGNGIILFKSKYGATQKYAEWLAEETGYNLLDVEKAKIKEIIKYKHVILCGAIYASGISGLKFLKKHYKDLHAKNIAIFCVGASPFDEKAFNAIKAHNLKDELKDIPLFYGRGAWNEEKMRFIDRTLCKLLQKVVSKKTPSEYEPWETALMEAMGKSCDWTDKSYLAPLLEHIAKW